MVACDINFGVVDELSSDFGVAVVSDCGVAVVSGVVVVVEFVVVLLVPPCLYASVAGFAHGWSAWELLEGVVGAAPLGVAEVSPCGVAVVEAAAPVELLGVALSCALDGVDGVDGVVVVVVVVLLLGVCVVVVLLGVVALCVVVLVVLVLCASAIVPVRSRPAARTETFFMVLSPSLVLKNFLRSSASI